MMSGRPFQSGVVRSLDGANIASGVLDDEATNGSCPHGNAGLPSFCTGPGAAILRPRRLLSLNGAAQLNLVITAVFYCQLKTKNEQTQNS